VELTSGGTKAARARAKDHSATDRLRLAANMALKRGREDFRFVCASSRLLRGFMGMFFKFYRAVLRDFDGRRRSNGILDRPVRSEFRATGPLLVTGVLRSAAVPPQ
jgi:hypothetical protein